MMQVNLKVTHNYPMHKQDSRNVSIAYSCVWLKSQIMCTETLVARAQNLAAQYKEMKVDRFLVRIPGTWEGIQAVKQLEAEGIPTHVTLIYRHTAHSIESASHKITAVPIPKVICRIKTLSCVTYRATDFIQSKV